VVVAAGVAAAGYVALAPQGGPDPQARELAIIAFGVLLTMVVLAFVYRSVARPVSQLGDVVSKTHDFSSRVPEAGPLEVAALGAEINAMIASLDADVAEKERIERRVTTAESSFRALFEGCPLASLMIDADTLEILDVNRAALEAFGYTREVFRTLKTSDLTVPVSQAQAALLDDVRHKRTPTVRFGPLDYRRADGSVLRGVGTSYIVAHADRTVRIAMIEDVTEKERIERQMQQAQRLESLGQLAGGIAHDFNNLLTVILNVTGSLKQSVSGGDARRDVERVDKAAQSASRLTHQLLAFARQEVKARSVLDVATQLNDLKDLLSRTIGSHIALTLDLAPDLWPVLMDAGQLEQIVINLSVNARDAMPRGGKLLIRARNLTLDGAGGGARPALEPGDYVELQVSDSGMGMDHATLEHAFEPFFTTKPVGQGTGMGLATVYGIVSQLAGRVSISSEVGRGTTVTILIPRTMEQFAPNAAEPAGRRTTGHGTILVVEDYPDLRELFQEILTGAGYTVLVAGDGAEAMTVGREHRGAIDLLLTDIVMPNLLGTDLAAAMQMEHPGLHVLLMSGHAQPVIGSSTSLPAGAKLLQKPFLEAELLDKVAEAMAADPVSA
jgi:hypothetical protein